MTWTLIKENIAYLMDGSEALESSPLIVEPNGTRVLKTKIGNFVWNDNAPVPKVKKKSTSEEAYLATLKLNTELTAPIRKPSEFGFREGDTYVIVDAAKRVAKAFDFHGNQVFAIPCLATGQSADWRQNSGDTPPGLYKIGEIYNDYARVGADPGYDRTLRSYGWITFDMIDLQGNEDNNARAGICWHGGGTGCGWPGAWAPKQALYPTLGCTRSHNIDLLEKVLPRTKMGDVYIAVYQDAA